MFLAVTTAPGAGAAAVETWPRIVAVVSWANAGVAARNAVARSAVRTARDTLRLEIDFVIGIPLLESDCAAQLLAAEDARMTSFGWKVCRRSVVPPAIRSAQHSSA